MTWMLIMKIRKIILKIAFLLNFMRWYLCLPNLKALPWERKQGCCFLMLKTKMYDFMADTKSKIQIFQSIKVDWLIEYQFQSEHVGLNKVKQHWRNLPVTKHLQLTKSQDNKKTISPMWCHKGHIDLSQISDTVSWESLTPELKYESYPLLFTSIIQNLCSATKCDGGITSTLTTVFHRTISNLPIVPIYIPPRSEVAGSQTCMDNKRLQRR